jgi:ATP-dependent exoDNAse (exonuclease V) beta subunit
MSQLKVYKASAGSGKTFRLAIEYIKLALTNESDYKHILAVTFTNKATAEMKSRIIGELYHLAKGKHSVYMDVLCHELNWQPLHVERQAQLVLKSILHDYSRFSISTIDSFFQRVIKAFNRELGINSAYNVELDEKSILEEATDRMIQSIEDDPKLLEWLDAFASDKISEGKGWNLKKDILRLGNEIYNETFKSLSDDQYEKLNNRAFLKDYRGKLSKIIVLFESKMKSLGQEGLNLMMLEGLSVDDFKGKGRGPATAFQKMKELNSDFSNTILAAAEDPSAWVTSTVKEPQKSKLLLIAEIKLMPKLQEAIRLIENQKRNYVTAKLINSQLYTLGILADLRKSVRELCREKGIVLISDSGHLLKNVIADSETPFVYEKTGAVYSHFMIDEFQDTSGLQWNNFKPLIGNSLSEDNLSLVVGDVKQAIYRWRSGDWRLLAGKLGDSFPTFGLQNEVLNSNWRSLGIIIRFNNILFNRVPGLLQQKYKDELSEAGITEDPVPIGIPEVYSDSLQQISKPDVSDLGHVRIRFLESKRELTEENNQSIFEELVNRIKSLQDNGVKAREMAILVRQKKEASQISDLFLKQKNLPENQKYNFDILSGESLFIANSEVIAFIISILTSFLNPDDQVVRAELNFLYYRKIYPRLKEAGVGSQELEVRRQETEDRRPQPETHYEPELNQQFEEINHPDNELIRFLDGKEFEEMLAGKPILEIIYSICEHFNLFRLADELAYLQAFVDQISVFERNHASEITSFLDWWDENSDRFTIPISESIDAINVLTIHKSKGLEFTYVFVPFFNWVIAPKTYQEQAPLLWCKPEVEPFNEMDLVPVQFNKKVGESIFYREYFTEKFNTYIDNLNLMYVVFTRAKAGLYIWSMYGNSMNTIGDLLKMAIENQESKEPGNQNHTETVQFSSVYDPEKKIFEWGQFSVLDEKRKEESPMKDVRLSTFEFADFRKFLNIRKLGEDFFSHENKKQSGINKGKIIHEVLSLITTTDDLPKAVKRIELEGKIGSYEAGNMLAELETLLNDQEVKSWFDGTFRVVNERNILTGANGIKRPDRIMIYGNEVIVVDYKSGDVESDKYNYQLRSYMRELRNCGYENVSGFIWYTRQNKRVAV